MRSETGVYRDLQKHLDRQAVGFPATRSGADIRLLKRMFTPREARVAQLLSYQPRLLEEIVADAVEMSLSAEETTARLDGMVKKMVIGYRQMEGCDHFFNLPLVVGMYEGQLANITPEFLTDFDAYTSDKAFGLAFLGTERSQMRTIPVEQSIQLRHPVATYDQLIHLITENTGPIVINECICRKSAELKGNSCRVTDRLETCMALGDIARQCLKAGMGREIDQAEALEIARRNEAEGLVLQPSNSQRAEFICACCGCCCGMLRLQRKLPRPLEFWSTAYHAAVTSEACSGCETCVDRCQVEALSIDADGLAAVDRKRCIGCGNCVVACPTDAMRLVPNSEAAAPPVTAEALYEEIMAQKKGRLGRLKLATRLVVKNGLSVPK